MKKGRLRDVFKFTTRFFSRPRFTGSILPSSPFLGKAMAIFAKANSEEVVVELGPGTGPVTAQLLKAGVKPANLYCVEFDKELCDILKRRFPEVTIINESAENLQKILQSEKRKVCAIVSSLPFLSLPKQVGKKIIEESESVLCKGGRFVQFTYNLNRNPDDIGFENMQHLQFKKVYLNVPPARVDVFEKQ